eukprot:TRINITY_DN3501_c0_g2_i3.p1 TRINITY_DN3501_c0_g2~~TRINITY_DN3501_c0_g2_i3.p1  ORF type:complete len:124 (+),score=39.60 TRINITY_DN3501_c0_g2_i3:89-460(+)
MCIRDRYWTNIANELSESVRTGIRNEAEARAFLSRLNFYVIDVAGSEVISAGKNAANEMILMFLSFEASGQSQLIVKSANQRAMQDVLSTIRSIASGGGVTAAPAPPPQAPPRTANLISDSLI